MPTPAPSSAITPAPTPYFNPTKRVGLIVTTVVLLVAGFAVLLASMLGLVKSAEPASEKPNSTGLILPRPDNPEGWANNVIERYTSRDHGRTENVMCGIQINLPKAFMTEKIYVWFGCE